MVIRMGIRTVKMLLWMTSSADARIPLIKLRVIHQYIAKSSPDLLYRRTELTHHHPHALG